jgi:feruloyl-CoA synthase
MLCSNQEMVRTVLPLLSEEPPVLCDWLPWNHTFGGNHNFGIVLYNGGTLYIDAGKPTPAAFETTVRNLREIATTAYFNVPRGYDLLVPRLRADRVLPALRQPSEDCCFALRRRCANRSPTTSRDLRRRHQARDSRSSQDLGATESAPFALCAGDADFTGGRVGVPARRRAEARPRRAADGRSSARTNITPDTGPTTR